MLGNRRNFLRRCEGKMSKLFDISKFDLYKEDNRREVKKAKGGLIQR